MVEQYCRLAVERFDLPLARALPPLSGVRQFEQLSELSEDRGISVRIRIGRSSIVPFLTYRATTLSKRLLQLDQRFDRTIIEDVHYRKGRKGSIRIFQSPFGCSTLADLLSASYTDPTDAGSLPEELDPFPELQLGNPQGVPTGDESAQAQQHHQQAPQPPPPAAPLPEDVQPDSLRYTAHCFPTCVSPSDQTESQILSYRIGLMINPTIGSYRDTSRTNPAVRPPNLLRRCTRLFHSRVLIRDSWRRDGSLTFGRKVARLFVHLRYLSVRRSSTPLPSFQETYTAQRYTRQELQVLGIKMDEGECYDNSVYPCATGPYPTEFSPTLPYHEQQPQQQHHHHPQQQQPAPPQQHHHHQGYFATETAPTPTTAVPSPANHRQDSPYGAAVSVPMVYGPPPSITGGATPVAPTDIYPTVDNVVVGTTRSRRASLPTQRSESAR